MFNPNDFANMFSQIQDNLKTLEEKQNSAVFTAKSGGGLVSVSVNGSGEVVDLSIDKSLLGDVESLQILLMGAINEAYKNVENNKKNIAMEMLGDLSSFKS